MENESFYEHCYALRHKPTKQWVRFDNDDLELTVTIIKLVTFKNSTISRTKGYLESVIMSSYFNNTPNYGMQNFLEFELVKVQTTYTVNCQ